MARKFAKIKPSFWESQCIRGASPNAKLLAIYLMTNHYLEMVGIYRLHFFFMHNQTGLEEKEARDALDELKSIGFCHYDDETSVVWVTDMALSQVADNPNEKQIRGVVNELARLYYEYEYPYVEDFLEKHGGRFRLSSDIEELHFDQ